mgnify:CR=1 FL=1
MLESNLPLWLAVMRKQRDELLPPLRVIKTALQVMYSRAKGGVDGATQYLTSLRSSTRRHNWAQRVTMDVLLSLATNAVLMFRTWSVIKDLNDETGWPSLTSFREMCSRKGGFNSFILELTARIMIDAAENDQAETPRRITPVERLPYNPKRYRRREYFNSDEGRAFRLSNRQHLRKAVEKAKTCIICSRCCHSACEECSTPTFEAMLCTKKRRNATTSCFIDFHTQTMLPDPRSHSPASHVLLSAAHPSER